MARKVPQNLPAQQGAKPKPAARPTSKGGPNLPALRKEIDRIDREIVRLLNERASCASRIGQIKARDGLDVWSPAREEEVIAAVLGANKGPLADRTIRLIFRELMSGSRALQQPIRVACLGPQYSYSYLASSAKFGNSVEHAPVGSIAAVFEEVNRGHVQMGIVPLENSTDGRIADTLDMFVRLPGLKIRAEVKLRVHHCLIGRCEWATIRRIYSKAQALSQCRNWLSKNFPQAQLIEIVSTAAAAELAQREEHAAAVASAAAAEAYGLQILARNIEDQPYNITRFAVIAHQAEERTGRDKTTLMIRVSNRPGSLLRVLDPFLKHEVNLTWIESFPIADGPPENDPAYLFFVDIEGHGEDLLVKQALDAARKKCERLEVLGSYPRSECIDD